MDLTLCNFYIVHISVNWKRWLTSSRDANHTRLELKFYNYIKYLVIKWANDFMVLNNSRPLLLFFHVTIKSESKFQGPLTVGVSVRLEFLSVDSVLHNGWVAISFLAEVWNVPHLTERPTHCTRWFLIYFFRNEHVSILNKMPLQCVPEWSFEKNSIGLDNDLVPIRRYLNQ